MRKAWRCVCIGLFLFLFIGVGILYQEGKGVLPKKESYNFNMESYSKKCQEIFGNQPIEIIIFFSINKNIYVQTSNEAKKVNIDCWILEKALEMNVESMRDVVLIVHNHLYPKGFSMDDKKAYLFFVSKGFRGLYCIWFKGKITHILVPLRTE